MGKLRCLSCYGSNCQRSFCLLLWHRPFSVLSPGYGQRNPPLQKETRLSGTFHQLRCFRGHVVHCTAFGVTIAFKCNSKSPEWSLNTAVIDIIVRNQTRNYGLSMWLKHKSAGSLWGNFFSVRMWWIWIFNECEFEYSVSVSLNIISQIPHDFELESRGISCNFFSCSSERFIARQQRNFICPT